MDEDRLEDAFTAYQCGLQVRLGLASGKQLAPSDPYRAAYTLGLGTTAEEP